MTKKYFAVVSIALVLCLALGFGVIKKGSTDDLTKTSPSTVVNNNDNLITGAKYNPDNVNALWTQSFDGLALPSGWLNLQDAGTGLWSFTGAGTYPTCSPHSGAGMASFQSYSINVGSNASLVSQSFSLTGGAAKLGFWFYRDANSTYATYADLVNFKINTSPSPTGATLLGTINRSTSLAPVVGAEGWYYYEFSIPTSFNTATNYIIFSAVSQYGDNMYMDDVNVSLLLAHDVGTYSIDVSTPVTPGVITPKATFKNFGTSSESFPVTMTITPGGYTNTQNVTSLASNGTIQVSFGNWTAANGSYTIKVYSQLSTDLDHTNDTLTLPVSVTTAGWLSGAVCPSPASLGAGVGYTRNDTGWVFSIAGQANLSAVTKYNVRTNTWTTVAPVPIGIDRFGACVLKDSIYVIGGATASSTYGPQVYKYDINANTWVTKASLPAALGWNKVVGYQDSLIYCAGGYNGTATQTQVLLYNARTDTWRTATSLPAARFSGGFSRIGDTLVYAAGTDGTNIMTTTYVGIISQTDRSVINWTTGAPIPTGIFRVDADMWGCKGIILAGGSTATAWTSYSNQAFVYSPYLNSWTTLANMTTALTAPHSGSVRVGPNKWRFVVACGYNGTAYGTPQIYADSLQCGVTESGSLGTIIPKTYSLSQNYPNPFNPVTRISYALPKGSFVTLKIYDIMGREVRTLVNEFKSANTYSVEFNASELSSGIYFYRINADGFTDIKKMMLVK